MIDDGFEQERAPGATLNQGIHAVSGLLRHALATKRQPSRANMIRRKADAYRAARDCPGVQQTVVHPQTAVIETTGHGRCGDHPFVRPSDSACG